MEAAVKAAPTYPLIFYLEDFCMKWKQFLTPVSSINGEEARKLSAEAAAGEVLYLDVRQPREYESGHLPGSILIPVGELDKRLSELDPKQATVIY